MRIKLAIILTLIMPNIMKSQNATATIENALSCSGESVLVAVDVTNFIDVSAMTLFIGYDSNAAVFTSLTNINPSIPGFFTTNGDYGQVGIAYSSLTPFSITSGKLFDLQFTFLGDSSFLPFNPGTEVANSDLEIIPLTTYAGSISNGMVIVGQPDSVQAYPDNDVSFSVAVTGTPAFQWQENSGSGWIDLQNNQTYSGVNEDTLFINDISLSFNGNLYRCVLTSGVCEDTTHIALLEVANAYPACTLGSISSCPGQIIEEPVYAGDLFDVIEFTFYISFDDQYVQFLELNNLNPVLTNGNLIIESITNPNGISIHWNDINPFSLNSGKLFDLVFQYNSLNNDIVFENGSEVINSLSNPINTTFTNGHIIQYDMPVIVQHPQYLTVTEGEEAVFSVNATSASSYQWKESQDGGMTWSNLVNTPPYQNVTSPALTIDPVSLTMDGYWYCCEVANEHCSLVSGPASLTVDSLTGIFSPVHFDNELILVPNPFRDKLSISSPHELTGIRLKLYDTSGGLIYSEEINGIAVKSFDIYLPELSNGLYMLEIDGFAEEKVFKENRKIIKSN